jgi:hypothetical protein
MRAFLAIAIGAAACASGQSQRSGNGCEQVGRAAFLNSVPEASGIAYAGGVLWTHNDSDAPVLYRIDRSGRAAPVTVAGADVRDWEDLAAGPCPGFAEATAGEGCLFIADIGDNQESRERITIYEVPVPSAENMSTKTAIAIHARYPDRPHDAEALLVSGSAQLKLSPTIFVVTKEVPARVYRFQASQNAGETSTLAFVRTLNEKSRITGAAVSPDERWVALRSNRMLLLYALDDFVKGGEPVRIDLRSFKEPQGEGVTFGSGGELYLVSEGGGKNAAGMLTRIHCEFIQ